MRVSWSGWICAAALLAAPGHSSQEIPKGVRYKKASPALNAKAEALLKKLIDLNVSNADILKALEGPVICGLSLWNSLKKAKLPELMKAGKATFNYPAGSKFQSLEGRLVKKPDAKTELWSGVLAAKLESKKLTIRKGKANEIQYYWAIISYDIEEPFFIADFGKIQFLFDFYEKDGKLMILFVDIVGRFGKS